MSKSWKQYGGVRKVDQFQSLTIGTLVADQVLLREKYSGSYIFAGSVIVNTDVVTGGSVFSKSNIYSDYDINVGRNIHLNSKIFFGDAYAGVDELSLTSYSSPIIQLQNDTNYAYLNGTSSGIGINTTSPSSALEVSGITDAQTNILTVSSLNPTNRSIISQNSLKKGIVVTATNGLSYIDFFNNATTNIVNTPDTRLQSSSTTFIATSSNILLSSSQQNTILSETINNITSGTTTSISSINTNIASSSNTNIYSVNNTDILSKLRIAKRFLNNPTVLDSGTYYNETTQIYDISNGKYLYDSYENDTFSNQTGNALSLISNDSSSNTFLNWITPNKNGFAIGGGSFINNATKNMGTLGLIDISGNFTPTQTIVSGTTNYKLKTTIGINTYSPRTDNYILDINGPIHLTNGEINKVFGSTFEIKQVSFAKNETVKTTGIAVGTASSSSSPYTQYISYTKNGGKTWSLSRVSTSTNLEQFSGNNLCTYTYDNSFAVIGTIKSLLFFTVNGGQTWIQFTGSGIIDKSITNIFVTRLSASSQRVFIYFTTNEVQYFDTNYSTLLTSNPSIMLTTITLTISTINSINGNDNTVYFAGYGIQSYNAINLTTNYTKNTSYSYNSIYAYTSTNVIAVGTNIISYTINGTDWSNITTISGIVGSFTLNNVYIYDSNNALAVGINGIIIYSTNWGSGNWSIVPNEILNASGISGIINKSTNTLSHIFMYDLNSIVISRLKTTFTPSVLGSSNIYYCYLPNLFNRANNNIFDICGNMTIGGDINIVESGQIKTNNSSLYVGNQSTLQQLFLGSDNTKNVFTGDVSMNKNLNIGLTTITSNLGIGVVNMTPKYSLDISGNVNVSSNSNITTNGSCIFQF